MTYTVSCTWCMDRKRVQLDARRSHPCVRCNPAPWQQPLIAPPFKLKRPWRDK